MFPHASRPLVYSEAFAANDELLKPLSGKNAVDLRANAFRAGGGSSGVRRGRLRSKKDREVSALISKSTMALLKFLSSHHALRLRVLTDDVNVANHLAVTPRGPHHRD